MKLLPNLASYALAAGSKSIEHWVNNFDTEAVIRCGSSTEGATHVSWFKTKLFSDGTKGPTVEVAEQKRTDGIITEEEAKEEGYSIDENGSLHLKKEEGFAPEDISNYECKILKDATPEDYKYKLLVNYLLERLNWRPDVRHKKLGKKNKMEYKEGAQYDIAECESQEAGPTAATLKWQVLDKDDRVLSDSSIFSACKDDSKDDSNFCGKTNDFSNDKKDERKLQTITMPLGFTAENFGGISSDFDETYFECVATYNVAKNGVLETFEDTARWPEGDKNIRVLHPVKNVEILVNGAAVQAGVLDTTYDEPTLSCDSDGYDNESENEIQEEQKSVNGEKIKFGCKAKNGRNDGIWVEKSYVFTEAYLKEPKIAKSHGGLVVEVSAESSPASAKQGSAVYNCKTLPKAEAKGTKANREMYEYLNRNCVKATAFGDGKNHAVSQNAAKKNPVTVAVSTLEVKDSAGNTETLYNYYVDAPGPRSGAVVEVAEFPIEAWFDKMPFGNPDDQIKAFFFNEETGKLDPVAGGFVDKKNEPEHEGQIHGNVEPQPTENGKYILCYDYEGNFDTNSYSGTYEEIQEEVHSDHADFCRFYENKSWIGGMLAFIWIPILLLAILAIYCIWLHCCREKENENEDEDQEDPEDPPTKIDENDPTAGPELQAVERTHSKRLKSDARDDFTEEDETTPMMQNEESE